MDSIPVEKPHAVMVPFPAQGHVTPMMKVAKLLHSKGFYITFVNNEYNHQRLVRSRSDQGSAVSLGLEDFRFEEISDGLPPPDGNAGTQSIPSLCDSTSKNSLPSFSKLLAKLIKDDDDTTTSVPKPTCVVSDACMSFTLDAAAEMGVPGVLFWTPSACGVMSYLHLKDLLSKGLAPIRSMDDLTNGYLDTPIEVIPGMHNMRLCDYPSFIRTTDPNDVMLQFILRETGRTAMASAVILNTFDALERPVLDAMSSVTPPLYTIGPLHLLTNQLLPPGGQLSSLKSSLWKEDTSYLKWLQGKAAGSVVYVNFGSITVMTNEQLVEFAWGLADSNWDFLWVIRPDLVRGNDAVLPQEFLVETEKRGLLAGWCPQEEVLSHPAIGGFLTHCGWNSTLESISAGVPMICWPFFAEQQTNCRYLCTEWGIGMEIDNNVRRADVTILIKELMEGEKGKEMRKKVVEWKEDAIRATKPGGSSLDNFERLVKEVLLPSKVI